MTYRFKSFTANDLQGFLNLMVANGYVVTFREGGNKNVLMCDVSSGSCVVRNSKSKETTDSLETIIEPSEGISEGSGFVAC